MSSAPDTDGKINHVRKINKKIQMGPEKLALSKLLYDTMIIAEAKQKGVLVSMKEAKNYANEIRQQIGNNQLPQNQELQDFISAMGEDYYCMNMLPKDIKLDSQPPNYKEA